MTAAKPPKAASRAHTGSASDRRRETAQRLDRVASPARPVTWKPADCRGDRVAVSAEGADGIRAKHVAGGVDWGVNSGADTGDGGERNPATGEARTATRRWTARVRRRRRRRVVGRMRGQAWRAWNETRVTPFCGRTERRERQRPEARREASAVGVLFGCADKKRGSRAAEATRPPVASGSGSHLLDGDAELPCLVDEVVGDA